MSSATSTNPPTDAKTLVKVRDAFKALQKKVARGGREAGVDEQDLSLLLGRWLPVLVSRENFFVLLFVRYQVRTQGHSTRG